MTINCRSSVAAKAKNALATISSRSIQESALEIHEKFLVHIAIKDAYNRMINLRSKDDSAINDIEKAIAKGRIKLFGTIVYPKNKYLSLGANEGIKKCYLRRCDRITGGFLRVLVDWKERRKSRKRKLDMPKDLCEEKHTNYSFTAGAGSDSKTTTQAQKLAASVSTCTLKQSTLTGFQSPSLPEEPIRQSRDNSRFGKQEPRHYTLSVPN
ncbi:hypothetical protein SELMODRAFT_410471 [Selaginella moellendorffii]|uniref:Uncharacterized protein n=1 Tax=Selaginella moellendorffii TaxID=88036 RepID=D8REV2_SELML|nr:hypothetical protein SELMODRAFT_410471 [Selaginella moellendorffii]